jgi:serine/threonine protein kinase
LIGNVVEKYEVIQKIGEGGMATVYRGRHLTLGRDVAIKVLHPHLSASERNRQRFAREARAIEHLEHDNILKIFDYSGVDAENCYIVTEFVDGVTLQELLNERTRFPSEITALIGIKLAQALHYAHELGIIHRDLKLENVMLRRDGELKLMDFGIARFLDEVNLTITGALVGSPAYMSPEQAMEKVLDSRSDLFSLGTLLYHLVTGHLPFSGANPSIVLRNVIESNRLGVQELAPDISATMADLIEQLMQTEPGDRPNTAIEVAERLKQCLDEVRIDPEDARWAVDKWLKSPSDFELSLRDLLSETLLIEGKARLAQSDHLGALRMFNRLLSVDENHTEVLDLLRGLHTQTAKSANRTKILPIGGAVLALVAGISWAIWPAPPDSLPGANRTTDLGGAQIEVAEPGVTNPEINADAPPAVVATGRQEPTIKLPLSTQRILAKLKEDTPTPTAAQKKVRAQPELGSVLVTVPGSWGDIYIDDELMGRTGKIGAIELTPGTHVLVIRNDQALPYQDSFTVAPGEQLTIEVTDLQRKPARVRLLNAPATECAVKVDGLQRGTIASLANTIRVRSPEREHSLTIQCPDGNTIERTLSPAAPGALVTVDLSTP